MVTHIACNIKGIAGRLCSVCPVCFNFGETVKITLLELELGQNSSILKRVSEFPQVPHPAVTFDNLKSRIYLAFANQARFPRRGNLGLQTTWSLSSSSILSRITTPGFFIPQPTRGVVVHTISNVKSLPRLSTSANRRLFPAGDSSIFSYRLLAK